MATEAHNAQKTNIIHLIDGWRVQWDGMSYSLERYYESRLYREPKTGQDKQSKAGWRKEGKFYANIRSAVKSVAKITASENAIDLKSFIKEYNAVVNEFNDTLSAVNLPR